MNDRAPNPSADSAFISQPRHRVDTQINVAHDIIFQAATMNLPPLQPSAPAPPEHFVGRKAEIGLISTMLCSHDSPQQVALYGMGGIGKTALVLEIAHRLQEHFSGGVFWAELDKFVENPQQILYSWGRVCTENLPAELEGVTLAGYVRDLLTARINTSGPILIICDHLSHPALETFSILKNAMPRKAALLLTMRKRTLADLQEGEIVAVEPFMEAEALDLLSKYISINQIEKERAAVLSLLSDIGHHPLATKIVGKRLKFLLPKPKYTIEKFYRQFIQDPFKDLGRTDIALEDLLHSTYASLPSRLQEIFCAIGVFVSAPITIGAIAAIAGLSQAEAEAELDELVAAALIDWATTEEEYAIHPLLRQYAGKQLQMQTDRAEKRKRHAQFCVDFVKENARFDPHSHDRLADILPDIMAAIAFFKEQPGHEEIITLANLLYTESKFLDLRSYVREAESLLTAAIASARVLQDRYHEVMHLGNLGNVYLDTGRLEQAFECYHAALLCADEVGDRELEMLLLTHLGRGYQLRRQHELARDTFQKALTLADALQAEESQCILMGNLGNAYLELGEMDLALDAYQKTQVMAQAVGDRRNVGVVQGNLGRLYHAKEQLTEAIEQYKQALAIADELGDVRNRAIWLGYLGNAYADAGQWQPAIDFYTQAAASAEKISDLYRQGIWLGNLGTVYAEEGEIQKAIDAYQKAFAAAEEVKDLFSQQIWLNNLGNIYFQNDKPEQAATYFEAGLRLATDQDDEQSILSYLINLVQTYRAMGQTEKADLCLVDVQKRLPDADSSDAMMLNILLQT